LKAPDGKLEIDLKGFKGFKSFPLLFDEMGEPTSY